MRILQSLLLIAAVAPRGHAWAAQITETWVDPVAGDDNNTGGSPNDALRTLTRALQNTAGSVPSDTIWLLPGTFSRASSGEAFPITVSQGEAAIRSTAGPEATVFDVGGGVLGFRLFASNSTVANVHLSGVSVRNSIGAGIGIEADQTAGQVTLESVRVRDCWFGIELFSSGVVSTPILIRDVRVEQCMTGLFGTLDSFFASEVIVQDSSFEDCTHDGILFRAEFDRVGAPVLERVRVLGSGTGIRFLVTVPGSPEQSLQLADCLIADNQVGIEADAGIRIVLTSCTVTANTNFGLSASAPLGTIDGSILWGNGADLEPASGWQVTRSDVGTPGYAPGNGNISVDPLFRDPVEGDFRLGFGTGCVDAIAGASGLDLSGFTRGNDGDLDLVGAGDMGAYELRTLDAPAEVSIGDKLLIDVHGELGQWTHIYLARGGQLAVPDMTPFGPRWLPLALLESVAMRKITSPDPVLQIVLVPDNPVLIGMQFSFQALGRSTAAPAGAAWGDAVTVTVVP